jgi:hypothetical protein
LDAELNALSIIEICRVLDLKEKFHREKIGRHDVEKSAFFGVLRHSNPKSDYWGDLGPVKFL